MKTIQLSQLLNLDFDLQNIFISDRKFTPNFFNDYLAEGRSRTILHLITAGQRRYLFNNKEFTRSAGSILLIPDSTRYFTEPISSDCVCQGIGISFDIVNQANEKIIIAPNIYSEWDNSSDQHSKLFHTLNERFANPDHSIFQIKSLTFRLLYNIVSHVADTSQEYALIEPAIIFMKNHYMDNVPISVYAEKCSLSESYFRKKFTECTDMSPIEYRNMLRFNVAQKLYHDHYSIQEIAEKIGFCDANYFSKLYKKSRGVSLKEDSDIV